MRHLASEIALGRLAGNLENFLFLPFPTPSERSVDLMSAQVKLHSIPDNSPLKVLLLRKCMRRIDKLKSFGIEQVR